MTTEPIFLYDVSEHQGPPYTPRLFDHARAYAEGFRGVMIRASQGTYRDPQFRAHLLAARKTPLLISAYVRIGDTSSAAENAAVAAEQIGDTRIPVWLDAEDHPVTEAKTRNVAAALAALGYKVIGNYLPHWFWSEIGHPTIRVGPLWSSEYVDGTGFAANLYEKVPASFWYGYGGQPIAVLQFTDKAKIAGQTVDASAFRGTLADLQRLFQATPTPVPAVHAIATRKGTVLDVAPLKGAGPRFTFRNLTDTDSRYPGCVCECIPRWVALVEALAKEAGLPAPLLFWEGSFITTSNSGTTHAGGGALDIKITSLTAAQVRALVKLCRRAGAAAWLRDLAHGRFDTPHIHVELIGCTHASQAARTQWSAYKSGRDGLAANGPDYGPHVAYITADDAFHKLTTVKSGDWLDMATQKEVQAAMVAAIRQELSGDHYPSPSLNPDSVKKNPTWTLHSMLSWQTKVLSLMLQEVQRLSAVFTRDTVPTPVTDPAAVKANPTWFFTSFVKAAAQSADRQEAKLDKIIDLLGQLVTKPAQAETHVTVDKAAAAREIAQTLKTDPKKKG